MSDILIRGGRFVDPSQGLDARRDLRLRDGLVAEIGEHLEARDAEIVDATNAVVAPGFIDMHVHLREPGQTHKETIATGSAAPTRRSWSVWKNWSTCRTAAWIGRQQIRVRRWTAYSG